MCYNPLHYSPKPYAVILFKALVSDLICRVRWLQVFIPIRAGEHMIQLISHLKQVCSFCWIGIKTHSCTSTPSLKGYSHIFSGISVSTASVIYAITKKHISLDFHVIITTVINIKQEHLLYTIYQSAKERSWDKYYLTFLKTAKG